MNDFPTCHRSTQCNQFADNTITYAQGNTVLEIEVDMQSDVNWCLCAGRMVEAALGATYVPVTKARNPSRSNASIYYPRKWNAWLYVWCSAKQYVQLSIFRVRIKIYYYNISVWFPSNKLTATTDKWFYVSWHTPDATKCKKKKKIPQCHYHSKYIGTLCWSTIPGSVAK